MAASVCRACSSPVTADQNIFCLWREIDRRSISCAEMLSVCGPYTVNEGDGFPVGICRQCYAKLCSAYDFRSMCELSYLAFLDRATVMRLDDAKLEVVLKEENQSDDDVCVKRNPDAGKSQSSRKRPPDKSDVEIDKKESLNVDNTYSCPVSIHDSDPTTRRQEIHPAHRDQSSHKIVNVSKADVQCDVCGRQFKKKANLISHLETHSDVRYMFACDVDGCSRSFVSRRGINRHKILHSGCKDFICQMCSKSFIDKYELDIHIRAHNGEHPFSCSWCDKTFVTASAKLLHEKRHNQIKDYVCQHCAKAFAALSTLKRHMLHHTKQKPQQCRFCVKRFSRLDHKKRHEATKHRFTDKTSATLNMTNQNSVFNMSLSLNNSDSEYLYNKHGV